MPDTGYGMLDTGCWIKRCKIKLAHFAFFGALPEMIFDSRMTRMTRITQIFSYLNFALFAFLEALRETLDTRIG